MSKLGDLIKKGLGAFTGGDLASNLVANYLTSKVLGGDTKDALMFTALQQGLGSQRQGRKEMSFSPLLVLICPLKYQKLLTEL
jgi:hypothetical protein